jgi:hypothetical protein
MIVAAQSGAGSAWLGAETRQEPKVGCRAGSRAAGRCRSPRSRQPSGREPEVPAHRPQDDRGREAEAAERPGVGHGQRSLSDGWRRERRSYPLAGRHSPRQNLRLPPTSCRPTAPNRGFLAAVRARPRGTGVYPPQRPKVFSTGRGGVREIRKVSARKGRDRYHPGEPQRLDRHTPGAHSGIARDNGGCRCSLASPWRSDRHAPALRPAAVARSRVRMPSGIVRFRTCPRGLPAK